MAGYNSIAAVGTSLVRHLGHCFSEGEPIPDAELSTKAVLVRTEDFEAKNNNKVIVPPALSVYLYRVDFNKTMRAAWSAVGHQDGNAHLPVDLHFLLTAWAGNAEYEHRILGRAMQCIEDLPILSGPLLDAAAGWGSNDSIQLCLEDLPTEDVMRTFDSLPIDYKLSLPYLARIVRVDGRRAQPDGDVATVVKRVAAGVGA